MIILYLLNIIYKSVKTFYIGITTDFLLWKYYILMFNYAYFMLLTFPIIFSIIFDDVFGFTLPTLDIDPNKKPFIDLEEVDKYSLDKPDQNQGADINTKEGLKNIFIFLFAVCLGIIIFDIYGLIWDIFVDCFKESIFSGFEDNFKPLWRDSFEPYWPFWLRFIFKFKFW